MAVEISAEVRQCWGCDAPLPDHRPKWCSQKCAHRVLQRKYSAKTRADQQARLRGRKCENCGGLMSVKLRPFAKYCSAKCRRQSEALRLTPQRREYYAENRTRILADGKKYRNENPKPRTKETVEREREWRSKNKKRVIEYRKAHYQNNKGYYAELARRRIEKVKQATPGWLTKEQRGEIAAMYQTASDLGLTVDHIVPLRGKNVSGLHVAWNLQLVPSKINRAKSNKHEPMSL